MTIIGIIVGIIILVLLVVVHELGHGIVANRNGVVVEEFGIGFPPRAWGRKLKKSILGKNVLFSLNWLPIGGFVKLQGEHDAAEGKGDYGAATFWQKTKIMLAGVGVNWVVAAILLTILAWTGLPQVLPHQFTVPSDTRLVQKPIQIVETEKGSPAAKAGLKSGDKIEKFNGIAVKTPDQLSKLTSEHQGDSVQILYSRSGHDRTVNVKLRGGEAAKKEGSLGVAMGQERVTRSTWSAPVVGVGTTAQFSWVTIKGIGTLIGNLVGGTVMQFSHNQDVQKQAHANIAKAKDSVAGPLSIVGVIFPAAEKAGPTQLLLLTAIISLTLAVMNVLPIPALDGGRWYTMAIFKVLRKKLTEAREEKIQATGFMILMVLIVLVTISDIGRVF